MIADISRLDRVSAEHAAAFRSRIDAARFAERVPVAAETHQGTLVPEELRRPLVTRALMRDPHPAARLALLFEHLLPVPTAIVDRELGPDMRAWLVEAGILRVDGEGVHAELRMVVADGVFIWSDPAWAGRDAVMTPGPTTATLIRMLPSSIRGGVLDVGTGPGTLALIAKRRGADRAVATDISERALALTRFNAAFNELAIEVRAGDLLAPVSGERFDWVIAQPPYVTHPPDEPEVTFLHGGPKGDELVFRFLEGVGAHLRPGGFALALFDSPVRADATLHDRVRRALGERLDTSILSQPGLDPDRQALGYAALADPTFGAAFRAAAVRYREHLERERIHEVLHALVVARAPASDAHRGWAMSLTVGRFPEGWDEVRAFLRGIDLAVAGEEAIARASVRPRDGATMNIERSPGAARDREMRSVRFAAPSLALDRELTEAGGVIFDLLAAEPSVASAIDRFAAAMEREAAEVRPLVTSFVRDCLMRALLVPA